MQTIQEQIRARVESLVFERDGKKLIALGNYALDFSKTYEYLGMSKSGQVILGDEGRHKKRYGKIYDNKIHAEGSRFIEKLPEVGGISI